MTNTTAATGQVIGSAADIYESFFVPALFAPWAEPMAEAAAIKAGDTVLDVGCGTGALTRVVRARVGPQGSVVGLDRNEGMLAVARRQAPDVAWRLGRAESLPFGAASFDVVTCQFALMFFEDQTAALAEMWRVLKPRGRLAIAVWDALERTPGYAEMTALLQRLFGDEVAGALRAPFSLGDPKAALALVDGAGISDARVETLTLAARFPSIEAWVRTDVKGWTLADMIDDDQYAALQAAAPAALQRFVVDDGSVAFASPAHILTATKPVEH